MEIEPKFITFSWNEADWLRAHRELLTRTAMCSFGICLTVCLLIAFCLLLENLARVQGLNPGSAEPWYPLVMKVLKICALVTLATTLWVGFSSLNFLNRASKVYRAIPESFVDMSWEINDDGLTYRGQLNRADHSWKLCQYAFFTRNFLMVGRKDGGINFIPRASFRDHGQAWFATISKKLRAAKDQTSKLETSERRRPKWRGVLTPAAIALSLLLTFLVLAGNSYYLLSWGVTVVAFFSLATVGVLNFLVAMETAPSQASFWRNVFLLFVISFCVALIASVFLGGTNDKEIIFIPFLIGGQHPIIFPFAAAFLFYFPWSIWIWRQIKYRFISLTLTGISVGALGGLVGLRGYLAVGPLHPVIGAACLGAVAFIHWAILTISEKRKPEWFA